METRQLTWAAPVAGDGAAAIPPLLCSGFRPFYLTGPLFGMLAMGLWLWGFEGGTAALPALFHSPEWHGHEMIFGFAGAICGGFILTALPSWVGTPAVVGRPLACLVAAWGVGRIAVLCAPMLPPLVVACADVIYFPLLVLAVMPCIRARRNRSFRLVLPILGLFVAGNLLFHWGWVGGAPGLQRQGLLLGFYGLVALYCLFAGHLTPIFTETWLREHGSELTLRRRPVVEALAMLSVMMLAGLDISGAPAPLVSGAAASAAAFHALRMAAWRSSRIVRSPLLLPMHLGYACLIGSFALQAAAAWTGTGSAVAVHAFTIGAWGLTKFSLLIRVSLKHTGRPLRVPPVLVVGLVWLALAALGRVAAGLGLWPEQLLRAAVVLWLVPMALYLLVFGLILARPSRPSTKETHHGNRQSARLGAP